MATFLLKNILGKKLLNLFLVAEKVRKVAILCDLLEDEVELAKTL